MLHNKKGMLWYFRLSRQTLVLTALTDPITAVIQLGMDLEQILNISTQLFHRRLITTQKGSFFFLPCLTKILTKVSKLLEKKIEPLKKQSNNTKISS